jgi:fructose-1,6-bisphosphatase/inositol monophosphatase family enzyme
MNPDRLPLLHEVADAVAAAFAEVRDFGPSGNREGQYSLDVVANDAALPLLRAAGLGVLSEESDFEPGSTGEVAVIDPIDGSTNASRGLPWFATAICIVDTDGPAVSLVANQASGDRFWAVRGGGAFRNGEPIRPSGCTDVGDSIIGLNGLPPQPLGYRQSRVYGAVALDLCMVACGVLDGFVDCDDRSPQGAHGVWDYLASTLIVREAGAHVLDLRGRDLVTLDHADRRTVVAAATPELLEALTQARTTHPQGFT